MLILSWLLEWVLCWSGVGVVVVLGGSVFIVKFIN